LIKSCAIFLFYLKTRKERHKILHVELMWHD
jgi:hypothetical protein